MAVDLFKAPSRDQLASMASGDHEIVRMFEKLFKAAGATLPAEIIDVDTSVLGANASGLAAMASIHKATIQLKSQGVLIWLTT